MRRQALGVAFGVVPIPRIYRGVSLCGHPSYMGTSFRLVFIFYLVSQRFSLVLESGYEQFEGLGGSSLSQ